MWAVVCTAAYDYPLLGVHMFNDFDKAARFVREEAEAIYEELLQDGENVSVHCNSGYAEIVINGEVEYIWSTDFVGYMCATCED